MAILSLNLGGEGEVKRDSAKRADRKKRDANMSEGADPIYRRDTPLLTDSTNLNFCKERETGEGCKLVTWRMLVSSRLFSFFLVILVYHVCIKI